MKSKILIFVVISGVASFSYSSAEERKIEGEISVDGQQINIEGNRAKYNEYRDLRDGVYGRMDAQYNSEKYYLDFQAGDIGYKTQHYEVSGGKWGSFKFYLNFDEIPHHFTFGARSFYSGIGGANLTYPAQPPSTDLSTWNTFDYSVERKNYAGGFKIDGLKPFFLDISISKEARKGICPIGAAGTSPGGLSLELPAPIDYTTDTIKLAAGYSKAPLFLSMSYFYSEFQNDNINLNFRNPATANTAAATDTFTLPHDNRYYKLDFKGAVKLPWNSKFNTDLAFSRTHSDAKLFNSYVTDVTAADSNIGVRGRTGISLSDLVFNGTVDTRNYAFVLTSNPVFFLDGKVFYKYYQKNNKSDKITITDNSASPVTFTNDLFDYQKNKYGAELGWKLPSSLYLTTGYTRVETKREREDIPENNDDIYGVELRWSGLDFAVAKVGYERLNRKAEFKNPTVTSASDLQNIETFIRRFDAANKDQDTYKASLDLFPVENLNFSIGYRYKKTDYKDTTLGLKGSKSNELNVDTDYLIGRRLRLFAYLDYEVVKLDQFQRQLPSPTTSYNPALPPTPTAFNWTVTETDKNYAYGFGTDIDIIPKKLTLKLQHSFTKSDGTADYTYILGSNPLPAGRTQDNIDIPTLDTYQLRSYLAKAIYNLTDSLSFSAGYVYEKYVYDDAQYNGYLYVPTSPTGTILSYLTGAYKDPSYEAHIVFLGVACKF